MQLASKGYIPEAFLMVGRLGEMSRDSRGNTLVPPLGATTFPPWWIMLLAMVLIFSICFTMVRLCLVSYSSTPLLLHAAGAPLCIPALPPSLAVGRGTATPITSQRQVLLPAVVATGLAGSTVVGTAGDEATPSTAGIGAAPRTAGVGAAQRTICSFGAASFTISSEVGSENAPPRIRAGVGTVS